MDQANVERTQNNDGLMVTVDSVEEQLAKLYENQRELLVQGLAAFIQTTPMVNDLATKITQNTNKLAVVKRLLQKMQTLVYEQSTAHDGLSYATKSKDGSTEFKPETQVNYTKALPLSDRSKKEFSATIMNNIQVACRRLLTGNNIVEGTQITEVSAKCLKDAENILLLLMSDNTLSYFVRKCKYTFWEAYRNRVAGTARMLLKPILTGTELRKLLVGNIADQLKNNYSEMSRILCNNFSEPPLDYVRSVYNVSDRIALIDYQVMIKKHPAYSDNLPLFPHIRKQVQEILAQVDTLKNMIANDK